LERLNLYSKYITNEAPEAFGDFKTEGQVVRNVKYTDDLVLLAKVQMVLQRMIDRLTEIGRCYGMEINVEKTKVMRISSEPSPAQIMIDQKQLLNMQYFNYLHSMITNNARCTLEFKSRIAKAKAAFNKNRTLFTGKLGLNLRKKLVKCYIATFGAQHCVVLKHGCFGRQIRNTWKVLKCGAVGGWRRSVGPIM
jgi:hypothetical protein